MIVYSDQLSMKFVEVFFFQTSGAKPIRTRTLQNHFVFFLVRDIPLRFIAFKSNFLGTYWSDLSNFCINTTTGSRSIIIKFFDYQKIFRRVFQRKKSFRFFLGQQFYFSVLSLQEAWKCWCLCTNRSNTIQLSGML